MKWPSAHIRTGWPARSRLMTLLRRMISLLLDVVAQEVVLISQIQPATADDRMRPTGTAAPWNLERSLHLVLFGVRCDQGHIAALVAEIKVAVRISHSRRTSAHPASRLPSRLAGQHVDAQGEPFVMAVAAIDVIAQQDHA